MNYNTNLTNKLHWQQWYNLYGGNQLLSDWIWSSLYLRKFVTGSINLVNNIWVKRSWALGREFTIVVQLNCHGVFQKIFMLTSMEIATLRLNYRSFSLQWTLLNAEIHGCIRCWKVSDVCVLSPKHYIYTISFKAWEHLGTVVRNHAGKVAWIGILWPLYSYCNHNLTKVKTHPHWVCTSLGPSFIISLGSGRGSWVPTPSW